MTWIVGMNASAMTFPAGFFTGKDSIGINEAALMFKTDMAFSVYPKCIKAYQSAGYTLENIIGARVMRDLQGQFGLDNWPNTVPGLIHSIYYNNVNPGKLTDVAGDVWRVMTTSDRGYAYHNIGTSLHLIIYWCALNKRFPIRLCGCNQTDGCVTDAMCHLDCGGSCLKEESRRYTQELIRCLNTYGDIVRHYENYEDCVKQEALFNKGA